MIDVLAPSVPDEAEPRAADDRALLKRLARSCRGGRVAIEADLHRLRHIHSPVLSQADGNQWLIGSLAILGALWWAIDWRWALLALPVCVLLYRRVGQPIIRRRMMRRVDRRLDDPAAWNKLWDFGGLVLREEGTDRRCAAPDQDWRSFARALAREEGAPA
jgi:hypothetical protein